MKEFLILMKWREYVVCITDLCGCPEVQRTWPIFWGNRNISECCIIFKAIELFNLNKFKLMSYTNNTRGHINK